MHDAQFHVVASGQSLRNAAEQLQGGNAAKKIFFLPLKKESVSASKTVVLRAVDGRVFEMAATKLTDLFGVQGLLALFGVRLNSNSSWSSHCVFCSRV